MNTKKIIEELISKHPPFEYGKRTHVKRWYGIQNSDGSISSVIRCSEPNCELNKGEYEIGDLK